MAKKIRKKGGRRIERWHLGLLAFAAVMIAMVVVGIMSGRSEPADILLGFFFEIALYGVVLLVALAIIWLIRKMKRTDKAEEEDSPFD